MDYLAIEILENISSIQTSPSPFVIWGQLVSELTSENKLSNANKRFMSTMGEASATNKVLQLYTLISWVSCKRSLMLLNCV